MRPRRGSADAERGMTVVEVALSLFLLCIFAGGTVILGRSMTRAFQSETSLASHDADMHEALDRIASRVRAADGTGVLPAGIASPNNSTWIDFTRLLGHDGTNLQWGPAERFLFEYDDGDPDDGVDNDGDGLVDEGRAVWIRDLGGADERRIVLSRYVAEAADGELLGNGVDDNGNGLVDEGGLAFELNGDTMQVWLTLQWVDAEGNVQTTSGDRTVILRNTGV